MNVRLFSAMGVGAGALWQRAVYNSCLWAQTQGRLSVSNHRPSSALGIWSEDAPYGKGETQVSK